LFRVIHTLYEYAENLAVVVPGRRRAGIPAVPILGNTVSGVPVSRKLRLCKKLYGLVRPAPASSSTAGPPTATSEAILPSSSISTADGVPPTPNARPTENC
jgi:hypothetical protein